MKRNIHIVVSLIALSMFMVACGTNSEPAVQGESKSAESTFKVYASNYPLYAIAKEVAGEDAEVINIMANNTSSHNWEPGTQDVIALSEADVFLYTGMQMESWAEKLINNGTITGRIIDASEGLELLAVNHDHDDHDDHDDVHDDHDDDHDDHDHGAYDPHIWLSYRNAEIISKNILDVLKDANPEKSNFYEENQAAFSEIIKAADEKFTGEFAKTKNKKIVVSHEAYGYLCRDYDFQQIGIEGINADGEPSLAQIDNIIKLIRDNNIKTVFYENVINPKVANVIAAEAGADTEMLSPLESLSDEQESNNDDYLSIMEENLNKILGALNE